MSSKNMTATGTVRDASATNKARGVVKKVILTSAAAAGTAVFREGSATGTVLFTLKSIAAGSFDTGRISVPFQGDLHVTLTTATALVEFA
jgi:hypothetical protein